MLDFGVQSVSPVQEKRLAEWCRGCDWDSVLLVVWQPAMKLTLQVMSCNVLH